MQYSGRVGTPLGSRPTSSYAALRAEQYSERRGIFEDDKERGMAGTRLNYSKPADDWSREMRGGARHHVHRGKGVARALSKRMTHG